MYIWLVKTVCFCLRCFVSIKLSILFRQVIIYFVLYWTWKHTKKQTKNGSYDYPGIFPIPFQHYHYSLAFFTFTQAMFTCQHYYIYFSFCQWRWKVYLSITFSSNTYLYLYPTIEWKIFKDYPVVRAGKWEVWGWKIYSRWLWDLILLIMIMIIIMIINFLSPFFLPISSCFSRIIVILWTFCLFSLFGMTIIIITFWWW